MVVSPIRVYGTHFDHRGEVARLESARLIGRHAEDGPPAVVMGDLNLQEESEPLGVFFDRGYRSAFRVAHPESEVGTFNGFRDASGGRRLDHILLDRRLEPLAAEIFDEQVNGVLALRSLRGFGPGGFGTCPVNRQCCRS